MPDARQGAEAAGALGIIRVERPDLRDPKIEHGGAEAPVLALRQHDVVGLEIAMDDLGLVRRGERVGDLRADDAALAP